MMKTCKGKDFKYVESKSEIELSKDKIFRQIFLVLYSRSSYNNCRLISRGYGISK